MAGTIHIPWYATGFRGDKLEAALADVTPTALRYGATEWSLHRGLDDRYKLLQIVHFEDKLDFQRWWDGPEMTELRAIASSWYQVPLLYSPNELVGAGRVGNADGNGNGGATTPLPEPEPAPRAAA